MQLSRRTAASDDKGLVRRIHHLAYREVVERQFGRWDEPEQDAYFAVAWPMHPYTILLADGEPCGYLAMEVSDDALHVHELVLDPTFQNRGIGTEVIGELAEEAGQRALPVKLQVLCANTRAIALYGRLGFEEYGQSPTHRLMHLPPPRPTP